MTQLAIIILLVSALSGQATDRFDAHFREAAALYWRDVPLEEPWLLLKTVAQHESALDPEAISPAGAVGLMQVLPTTADLVSTWHPGLTRDLTDPRTNILIGAAYLRHLWNDWTAMRSTKDHALLALGSYNAGEGHLLDAQRRAGGARDWGSIVAQLRHETGARNAMTTLQYAESIWEGYENALRKARGTQTASKKDAPQPTSLTWVHFGIAFAVGMLICGGVLLVANGWNTRRKKKKLKSINRKEASMSEPESPEIPPAPRPMESSVLSDKQSTGTPVADPEPEPQAQILKVAHTPLSDEVDALEAFEQAREAGALGDDEAPRNPEAVFVLGYKMALNRERNIL